MAAERRVRAPQAAAPAGDESRFGPGDIYANVPPIDDRGRDQLTMFRIWNSDPIGNQPKILASVDPRLAAVVRKAQADDPDVRFVVGSGRRTEAEQRQAALWGWSPYGRSAALRKHIDGLAVDLWPLDDRNRVTFDPVLQARVARAMMKASRELGIRVVWGGAWRSARKDPPHFELAR